MMEMNFEDWRAAHGDKSRRVPPSCIGHRCLANCSNRKELSFPVQKIDDDAGTPHVLLTCVTALYSKLPSMIYMLTNYLSFSIPLYP
jgi:hypothetical protein